MTRTITMRPNENANGDVGMGTLLAGGTYVVSSALAHDLINRHKADYTLPSYAGSSIAFVTPRTTAQLLGTPPAEDIAAAAFTEFVDSLDATKRYVINSAGTAYVSIGGGGSSSFATLSGSPADSPALAAALAASADGYAITPPVAFNFPSGYMPKFRKIGRSITTDANPRKFAEPLCYSGPAYHVNPVTGADTNTGIGSFDGDFTNAVATVGKAVTLGNATGAPYRVIFKGGQTLALKDILFGGAAVLPTQSVAFIGVGAKRATLSSHGDPNWVLSSGTMWTGTVPGSTTANPVGRVMDMVNLDDFNDFSDLVSVASSAICSTTPNSFYVDTTVTPNTIYVNRTDAAQPTSINTRCFVRIATQGAGSTYTKTMWIENLEFHGGEGQGAFRFLPANSTAILVGDNVAARYSGQTAGNGFSINGGALAFLSNWECSGNQSDGFNVHDSLNGTTGYGTVAISLNGHGYNNGKYNTTSCNGFTTHDGVRSIDINGRHHDNYGGNSAHVSTPVTPRQTAVYSLGSYIGRSRGNPVSATTRQGSSSLQNSVWSSSAALWFDSCVIEGRTAAIAVDATQQTGTPGAVYLRDTVVLGPTSVDATSSISAY